MDKRTARKIMKTINRKAKRQRARGIAPPKIAQYREVAIEVVSGEVQVVRQRIA